VGAYKCYVKRRGLDLRLFIFWNLPTLHGGFDAQECTISEYLRFGIANLSSKVHYGWTNHMLAVNFSVEFVFRIFWAIRDVYHDYQKRSWNTLFCNIENHTRKHADTHRNPHLSLSLSLSLTHTHTHTQQTGAHSTHAPTCPQRRRHTHTHTHTQWHTHSLLGSNTGTHTHTHILTHSKNIFYTLYNNIPARASALLEIDVYNKWHLCVQYFTRRFKNEFRGLP